MTASRRELLIRTAVDLFYKHGYHATGIDKILTTAGVSKPTLYRHFESKDELIVAALNRWDEDSREWLADGMKRHGNTPREQIIGLFDTLEEWFSEEGFHGCIFVSATLEYPKVDSPIHQAAAAYKHWVAEYVCDRAVAAGASNPQRLAKRIAILMEGAIIAAQMGGGRNAARVAKEMALEIVEQACGSGETAEPMTAAYRPAVTRAL